MAKIELKTATIELDESGFLWTRFKNDIELELENAREHKDAILQLCEGKARPFINDGTKVFGSISPEAKEFLAKDKEIQALRLSQAFIVDTLATRMIARVFVRFNKPANPTHITGSREDAINWSRKFLVCK